jgi:hypothetical protein
MTSRLASVERLLRVRDRQIVELRRLVEALEVRVEAEDGRAVGRRVRLHPSKTPVPY